MSTFYKCRFAELFELSLSYPKMITEKVPKSFSKNEIFFSITNFSQPIYKPLHYAVNTFFTFFLQIEISEIKNGHRKYVQK